MDAITKFITEIINKIRIDARKGGANRVYPLVAFLLGVTASCGKPASHDPQIEGLDGSGAGDQTEFAVKGTLGIGSECAYGFTTQPRQISLKMENCPFGRGTVELLHNLQSVYFQGDCGKKYLTVRIRNPDGSPNPWNDSTWEVSPDGRFDFMVDGAFAELKSDGTGGHQNCVAPLRLEFEGWMDCSGTGNQRDKAVIHLSGVDSRLWTSLPGATRHAPSQVISPQQPGHESAADMLASMPQCSFPNTETSQCYFTIPEITINQCGSP